MTLQEQFDTAVAGLLKQNCKSQRITTFETKRCVYRGPNGTKCAVGFLIPDELYDPAMDHDMPLADVIQYLRIKNVELDKQLCHHLQAVHDGHEPTQWHNMLISVAIIFELNPNVIDEYLSTRSNTGACSPATV